MTLALIIFIGIYPKIFSCFTKSGFELFIRTIIIPLARRTWRLSIAVGIMHPRREFTHCIGVVGVDLEIVDAGGGAIEGQTNHGELTAIPCVDGVADAKVDGVAV